MMRIYRHYVGSCTGIFILSIENKYPKPSFKTVTKGDEREVLDGDVRALGEVVRLDRSLVTGGLPQKNAMFPPQKGFISSTISIRMTMMITNVWAKLCKLRER